jgi:hypothetical protein
LWEVFALGVQPYYGHSNEQVRKFKQIWWRSFSK